MAHRIVVADDHKLVRAGVTMMLDDLDGYEVVAEADNGADALQICTQLKPDLAILDIHMPQMTGLECLMELKQQAPEIKVLMLSMHSNEEHVARAISLGANGYLLKDSTPDELELAVKSVISGNVWLSSAVSKLALSPTSKDATETVVFTVRQTEVMRRLTEGESIKEIAFAMDLSVKTIETYRSQIMKKLDLKDLPSLVKYAIKNGITSIE